MSIDTALAVVRSGTESLSTQFPLDARGQSWQIVAGAHASSAVGLCRSMVVLVEADATEALGAVLRVLLERVLVGHYLLHGEMSAYEALLKASHLQLRQSASKLGMPAPAWRWGVIAPSARDTLHFKDLVKRTAESMNEKGCGGEWVKDIAEDLYPFECASVHTNIEEVMGAFLRPIGPDETHHAYVLRQRDHDHAADRLTNQRRVLVLLAASVCSGSCRCFDGAG